MQLEEYILKIPPKNLYFCAPKNDSVVPGTIAGLQKGTWHFDKIDFNDKDIFLDIGCNIGLVSMFVSVLFPNIQIYSFDPNPIAIDCLNKAIIKNNIKNIVPIRCAVGSKNGESEFITYSENETCLIEKKLSDNARDITYTSPIMSIDDIFDNLLINKNVKFAKIDIETGEFDLFKHIFNNRPDILDRIEYLHCEIHPFDQSFPESKKLKDMLDIKFRKKVFYF